MTDTKPTRRDRIVNGSVIGLTLAGVAAISLVTFGPLVGGQPEPTPTSISTVERQIGEPAEIVPTPTPTVEPVVEAPPPAPVVEEPVAPPFQPTLCPPGTVAGAVDENGNESNCGPNCAAYIDNDGDGVAETCVPYQSRRDSSELTGGSA